MHAFIGGYTMKKLLLVISFAAATVQSFAMLAPRTALRLARPGTAQLCSQTPKFYPRIEKATNVATCSLLAASAGIIGYNVHNIYTSKIEQNKKREIANAELSHIKNTITDQDLQNKSVSRAHDAYINNKKAIATCDSIISSSNNILSGMNIISTGLTASAGLLASMLSTINSMSNCFMTETQLKSNLRKTKAAIPLLAIMGLHGWLIRDFIHDYHRKNANQK